jgi:hypothetical protein
VRRALLLDYEAKVRHKDTYDLTDRLPVEGASPWMGLALPLIVASLWSDSSYFLERLTCSCPPSLRRVNKHRRCSILVPGQKLSNTFVTRKTLVMSQCFARNCHRNAVLRNEPGTTPRQHRAARTGDNAPHDALPTAAIFREGVEDPNILLDPTEPTVTQGRAV